jgi:hypothetical protein
MDRWVPAFAGKTEKLRRQLKDLDGVQASPSKDLSAAFGFAPSM